MYRCKSPPNRPFVNAAPTAVAAIPPTTRCLSCKLSISPLSANYFTQLTERLSGSLKVKSRPKRERILAKPTDRHSRLRPMGRLNVLPEMLAAFHHPQSCCYCRPIIKTSRFHPGSSGLIIRPWTNTRAVTPDRVRKADGRRLHGYHRAADYLQHHPRQLSRSTGNASGSADSVLAQKAGDLPGYGLALRLLPGSYRSECSPHHHSGTRLLRCLAGARDFSRIATIDDVSLLTKRTAEGIYDITLVETTCMNMGQSVRLSTTL